MNMFVKRRRMEGLLLLLMSFVFYIIIITDWLINTQGHNLPIRRQDAIVDQAGYEEGYEY